MNDSFQKIAEELMKGERIYLFPHENPDGDAIGSTAALCSMLRGMGKESLVLLDEEIPDNLAFMDDGMFVILQFVDLKARDFLLFKEFLQLFCFTLFE